MLDDHSKAYENGHGPINSPIASLLQQPGPLKVVDNVWLFLLSPSQNRKYSASIDTVE